MYEVKVESQTTLSQLNLCLLNIHKQIFMQWSLPNSSNYSHYATIPHANKTHPLPKEKTQTPLNTVSIPLNTVSMPEDVHSFSGSATNLSLYPITS